MTVCVFFISRSVLLEVSNPINYSQTFVFCIALDIMRYNPHLGTCEE